MYNFIQTHITSIPCSFKYYSQYPVLSHHHPYATIKTLKMTAF